MPIGQLRNKAEKNNNSFSTRRLGIENGSSARKMPPASEPSSWGDLFAAPPVRSTPPPSRRRGPRRSWGPSLIRAGLIVFLIFGISAVTVFAWYSKDLPDPNKIIERDVAQSTKIYDRTGEHLLYEIHGTERRTLIELADIPQYAIDATVAIEDKNFFKHQGLSLTGIVRAIVLEVAQKVGLYDKNVPGGSTLTQQFIKNAVLTTEKAYSRKIKEWVLAYRLEKKFSKSEILKLYFNEIPYGSTAYGIEAASHIYFDKPAKELTLGEAAILAAMPQAPSYYSPYGSHRDELIGRQRYVLKLMVEQGYITEEQAQAARDEQIEFKKRREDILAPHFVFMVKEELSAKYGERLVEQGGLTIITTLDLEKQKKAEDVITEIAPKNAEKYNAQNASLVTIETQTGQVLALVGSRDYFNDDIRGQVNVAVAPRQPGSSIKPVIYAEAFNRGYRPDTILFDLVTSFAASGKEYKPQNYDGKERGPVTLRQALQGSLNIPAVKTLYLVGVRRAVELARELGYSTLTDPDRYGLSLVLGGAEVKLIEHTNAYATFAREGIYKPYVSVLKVSDSSGTVLEEHRDDAGRRVLPREVVRTLNTILTDNNARAYIFGASNYLTLPGRPVAAKTGTTNDYHDAWTMGFTPSIATGVWVGNSDNTEMNRGADGSVIAAPIWQKYMAAILGNSGVESFKEPESPGSCPKPVLCGQVGSERTVQINIENGKLASNFTPFSKIQEVVYRETHEILHYVDRDDPLGPAPSNPSDDPQYRLWEEPVQRWAAAKGYVATPPPTEVDDMYRGENAPAVSWVWPQPNDTLTGSYNFVVQASGPQSISRVDYYLNSKLIGTSNQSPFSYLFKPTPGMASGTYTLTAAATDSSGNEGRASLTVTIHVDQSATDWNVGWTSPAAGSYRSGTLPADLTVSVRGAELIQKIDFYSKAGGSPAYHGFENVSGRTSISHKWSPPTGAGTYELYVVVTDLSNAAVTLPAVTITVTP